MTNAAFGIGLSEWLVNPPDSIEAPAGFFYSCETDDDITAYTPDMLDWYDTEGVDGLPSGWYCEFCAEALFLHNPFTKLKTWLKNNLHIPQNPYNLDVSKHGA